MMTLMSSSGWYLPFHNNFGGPSCTVFTPLVWNTTSNLLSFPFELRLLMPKYQLVIRSLYGYLYLAILRTF